MWAEHTDSSGAQICPNSGYMLPVLSSPARTTQLVRHQRLRSATMSQLFSDYTGVWRICSVESTTMTVSSVTVNWLAHHAHAATRLPARRSVHHKSLIVRDVILDRLISDRRDEVGAQWGIIEQGCHAVSSNMHVCALICCGIPPGICGISRIVTHSLSQIGLIRRLRVPLLQCPITVPRRSQRRDKHAVRAESQLLLPLCT